MRQNCVTNASKWVLFFKIIGTKGTFQNAPEMRQNCVKNARNTFGGEHLLDDTDIDKTVFCETPETLPRLFWTLFGPGSRTAPADSCKGAGGVPTWDSLALPQGLFGLVGPKVAERVRNEFPGPLGPGVSSDTWLRWS